jgi:RNA polymerase sigma-70 factor (ECF subfamily)
MSLARDEATACDLVQETFCIWAEKGGQLRDKSKAKSWLFTTLHREFLSHRRRAARFSDEPLDENTTESIPWPDEVADRQLDGQRALELLGDLDENYRAPVTLFYLQQHSYKDIAAILDVPIGTVMSRLARGKELLRRKMTAGPASAPKNILRIQQDSPLKNHG